MNLHQANKLLNQSEALKIEQGIEPQQINQHVTTHSCEAPSPTIQPPAVSKAYNMLVSSTIVLSILSISTALYHLMLL